MKKLVLLLGLTLLASSLLARPYLARYVGEERVIIFEGTIKDEDEPKVVLLQTQYLESLYIHPNRLHNYEIELHKLGVTVTKMARDPYKTGDAEPYYPPTLPQPAPSTPESSLQQGVMHTP